MKVSTRPCCDGSYHMGGVSKRREKEPQHKQGVVCPRNQTTQSLDIFFLTSDAPPSDDASHQHWSGPRRLSCGANVWKQVWLHWEGRLDLMNLWWGADMLGGKPPRLPWWTEPLILPTPNTGWDRLQQPVKGGTGSENGWMTRDESRVSVRRGSNVLYWSLQRTWMTSLDYVTWVTPVAVMPGPTHVTSLFPCRHLWPLHVWFQPVWGGDLKPQTPPPASDSLFQKRLEIYQEVFTFQQQLEVKTPFNIAILSEHWHGGGSVMVWGWECLPSPQILFKLRFVPLQTINRLKLCELLHI